MTADNEVGHAHCTVGPCCLLYTSYHEADNQSLRHHSDKILFQFIPPVQPKISISRNPLFPLPGGEQVLTMEADFFDIGLADMHHFHKHLQNLILALSFICGWIWISGIMNLYSIRYGLLYHAIIKRWLIFSYRLYGRPWLLQPSLEKLHWHSPFKWPWAFRAPPTQLKTRQHRLQVRWLNIHVLN